MFQSILDGKPFPLTPCDTNAKNIVNFNDNDLHPRLRKGWMGGGAGRGRGPVFRFTNPGLRIRRVNILFTYARTYKNAR